MTELTAARKEWQLQAAQVAVEGGQTLAERSPFNESWGNDDTANYARQRRERADQFKEDYALWARRFTDLVTDLEAAEKRASEAEAELAVRRSMRHEGETKCGCRFVVENGAGTVDSSECALEAQP